MSITPSPKVELSDILETHRKLLAAEFKEYPAQIFISNSKSSTKRGFEILGVCLIIAVIISIPAGFTKELEWATFDTFSNLIRVLPFMVAPALGYVAAIEYTNWRQKRATIFELSQELRGERFAKIRNEIARRVAAADGKKDIESLAGWFPADNYLFKGPFQEKRHAYSSDDFENEHALGNMAVFLFKIYLYAKHDLLEKSTTRHMFHHFFSHYQILMLEFAAALRKHRQRLARDNFAYDDKWDLLPYAIEKSFAILNISSALPEDHKYIYFPSASDINYKILPDYEILTT